VITLGAGYGAPSLVRLVLPADRADILVNRDILGSANPHGVSGAVNLYAALPSLHVCWAAWCAFAVVTTTRGRWRHLAWLYPSATAFVVLSSANHFVLDVIGGLAIVALGLAVTGMRSTPDRRGSMPGTGTGTPLGSRSSPMRIH
jgi:hypothetical protein